MGLFFDKNTANSLKYGVGGMSGINGSPGLSFHAWVWLVAANMTSGVNDNGIFTIIVNSTSVGFTMNIDQSVGAVPKMRLSARSGSGDARQVQLGATTLATGQWIAVGGSVEFNSKVMRVYYNGVADGNAAKTFANTTYIHAIPSGEDTIGGLFTPTPATVDQLGGHVAEFGLWKDELAAEDFRALGVLGMEPKNVRPNLLYDAVSLLNNTRIHGVRGNLTGTIAGTINQSGVSPRHPRIARP